MSTALSVLGVLLVLLAVADVAWTALAPAAGRGPATHITARAVWRLTYRLPMVRRDHGSIQTVGYTIVAALILTWFFTLWLGWSTVWMANPRSVVDATTSVPADALGKMAFAGTALFGGGGGYVAGSSGWSFLQSVSAATGYTAVSLAIAYIIGVVAATVNSRRVAGYVAGMGWRPVEIVRRGRGREDLGAVGTHLLQVSGSIGHVAYQHLAYPVLHYLHTGSRWAAFEPNIATLDETLTIIEHGLPDPDPGLIGPLRDAVDRYLETVPVPDLDVGPPPVPDLAPLREDGIEVVEQDTFRERVGALDERRRQLHRLAAAAGWEWTEDGIGVDERAGIRDVRV